MKQNKVKFRDVPMGYIVVSWDRRYRKTSHTSVTDLNNDRVHNNLNPEDMWDRCYADSTDIIVKEKD